MKRKLYVHGRLAERFGKEPLCMRVESLPQVLDAWEFAHPEFRKEFLKTGEVAFLLKTGKTVEVVNKQLLTMQFGNAEEVHIVPKLHVADPVTIGAMLVSSLGGIEFAAAVGATGVMIANYVAAGLVYLAFSAVGGAIIQALTPKPSDSATKKQNQSNLLSNAPNYVEEGGVVPVVFGTMLANATLIDFGTAAEELPIS
jgi:predicted phage tail protein